MTFDFKELPTCINDIINNYTNEIIDDCPIINHFNNIEDILEYSNLTKVAKLNDKKLKVIGEECIERLRYYSHTAILNDYNHYFNKECIELLFRNGSDSVSRFYFPINTIKTKRKYFQSIVNNCFLNKNKTVGINNSGVLQDGEFGVKYSLLKRYNNNGVFNRLDYYRYKCYQDPTGISWHFLWSKLVKGIYYKNHYNHANWREQYRLMGETDWKCSINI